ncbi:MAG: pilus assembly protein PilM [Candidatus Dojkabacteria bacterium]|nr:pilus assembly protein PilM [Candidatus Dojkabacteria bacterium]
MSKINFISINIGSTGLKFCMSRYVRRSFIIEYLYSYYFQNSISASNLQRDVLKKEILNAFRNLNLKYKKFVISIPEQLVYSRLIEIPFVSEKEIIDSILWTIKPLLPVDISLVNVSHIVVGTKYVNNSQYLEVFVVAVPKEIVNEYKYVFDDLNLELIAIETEAVALSRLVKVLCNEIVQNQDVMVLDFGYKSSTVIILRYGVPIFSQSIEVGSFGLTKSISVDLGIDFNQAEYLKTNIGIDLSIEQNKKIYFAMLPFLEALSSEISRIILYYKDKINVNGLRKLILSGGGSTLKNLDLFLAEKFNMDVFRLSNYHNKLLFNTKSISLPNIFLPSFEVCMGLSMKGYV